MKSNQSTNTQEQLGYQKADQNNCKFWWVVLLLCWVLHTSTPQKVGPTEPTFSLCGTL